MPPEHTDDPRKDPQAASDGGPAGAADGLTRPLGPGDPHTRPLDPHDLSRPSPDPWVGRTLSQYRILERLGEGGMGVVYKAQDTRLNRVVALKFLTPQLLGDPGAKERFLREAQAAAGLDDPHIGTVHEIHEADGHTFIVMNYVAGGSLKEKLDHGPLGIREALEIARQIGRGLAAAHRQGIVHRDIKPGNILLTPDGQVKIADFGLAKLAAQTQLTRTGTTLGTLSYMAPEQMRGDDVDHRADIWALGVVLSQLLTGKLPFGGETDQAVLHAVLKRNPRAVSETRKDVPFGVEKVVARALAKNPAKRYQRMEDMLADLEIEIRAVEEGGAPARFVGLRRFLRKRAVAYGASAVVVVAALVVGITAYRARATVIDSVAVLPLVNLSGDQTQEYFSDGMTEALIDELGKIGAMKVISRTSVMRYKNGDTPLPEIARALNVDAVLEGSVARSGNRVEVSVRLIDPARDLQLWSESFERHMRDILDLRNEVAQTIAREIRVELAPQERERLEGSRKVDPRAYDEYLKGLSALTNNWSRVGADSAIVHFDRALAADPEFAPAYAGLARAYSMPVAFYPREEIIAKAIPAATRALELDGTIGDAYGSLGTVKFLQEGDWIGPDREYQRAVELSPNDPLVHHDYSFYLVLSGRAEEGIEHARRAVDLDPLTPTTNLFLGWAYLLARRYEEAIEQHRKTLALLEADPELMTEYWVYYQMALDYMGAGMYDDAKEAAAQAERFFPQTYTWIWLEYLSGDPEKARSEFRDCETCEAPLLNAATYALFVDYDKAFESLNRAYEVRDPMMNWVKVWPSFDPLRSDPRYAALLERAGIPPG